MGFLKPNINRKGRIMRTITGIVLLLASIPCFCVKVWWIGGMLVFFAAFSFYEAKKSWCVMRACGIKTKI